MLGELVFGSVVFNCWVQMNVLLCSWSTNMYRGIGDTMPQFGRTLSFNSCGPSRLQPQSSYHTGPSLATL